MSSRKRTRQCQIGAEARNWGFYVPDLSHRPGFVTGRAAEPPLSSFNATPVICRERPSRINQAIRTAA